MSTKTKRVDIGSTVVLSDGKTYRAVAHPDTCVRDSMKVCTGCDFRPQRHEVWGSKLCREVYCSVEGAEKRIFREVKNGN